VKFEDLDGLISPRMKIKCQVVLLADVRTPYLVLHATGGAITIHTCNHADPLILMYEFLLVISSHFVTVDINVAFHNRNPLGIFSEVTLSRTCVLFR